MATKKKQVKLPKIFTHSLGGYGPAYPTMRSTSIKGVIKRATKKKKK